MSSGAVLIIEVVAGLIPQRPEPEFTKRWAITGDQWHEAGQSDLGQVIALDNLGQQADEYARSLRDPSRVNWVRTDWIWV